MNIILAYRIYPEPNGTDYFEKDLQSEFDVECLFDFCQILEAIIFREGWHYLVDKFGYANLFKIDKRSMWIDCDTLEEYIEFVKYEQEHSPMSP